MYLYKIAVIATLMGAFSHFIFQWIIDSEYSFSHSANTYCLLCVRHCAKQQDYASTKQTSSVYSTYKL